MGGAYYSKQKMYPRTLIFLLVILCLSPAVSVEAQEIPRPEVLLRAWAAGLRAQAADLSRIELRERSNWVLDGPFGVRRTHMLARVTGGPDTGGWERDPIRVEVNGRRVPLQRWHTLDERRQALTGPRTEVAAREILQLALALDKLRPADRTQPERIHGVPAWRVELVSHIPEEAIQRCTLWFDQAQGHLLRSRAVVRTERNNTPLTINTRYTHVEGFDVPSHRRIEGTTQTQRRRRTYTLLFDYEASYDHYRFIRR